MKKINNLIIVVISVVSYIIALYNLKRKILVRFLIGISSLIVLLVPKILRKKIKISNKIELSYLIFVVFAYFLGTVINFYDRFHGYDTLMHFLSGVFEAYIALELFKKKNLLDIFGFVALVSVGWEIFEFISSIILNVDPQRVELTGVTDTMKDLIVALLGTILLIICKRKIRKN